MASNDDLHAAASQTSNDDNLFVTSDKDNMAMDTDPVEPPENTNMDADIDEPANNVTTDNDPDPASNVSAMPSEMKVTRGESVAQAFDHGAETARLLREAVLKKQKENAKKFRERKAVQEAAIESNDVPDEEEEDIDGHPKIERKARGKYAPSARFKKQKQAFMKKQAAGRVTEEEEIAFMKAESQEAARLRKLEADEEFDRSPSPNHSDDGGLFVEEGPSGVTYSELHSDDDEPAEPKKKGRKRVAEDGNGEKPSKRSKPKNSGKKDRKVAGTEYTEGDVEKVIKKAKGQSKEKKKPTKTAVAKGNKAKGQQHNMLNLASLRGTNLFHDVAAVADLPDQPEFQEGNEGHTRQKKQALKQLIASVPTDSKESKAAATSDMRALEAAFESITGKRSVKPKGGNWELTGMRATLKHYQIMGTAFMRDRENAAEQPRGGILADEMGLGKTIMMLANIVNGKPPGGKKPRATLIVASPALISQWEREIRTHCQTKREDRKHGIGTVIMQRTGSRINSNNDVEILEDADIVLTTYHEVMKSYPKVVVPTELTTAAQKDAWWKVFYEENRGVLHRVKWLRVVLDEAHAIKNHKSHTSLSCRALRASHYWAITGTPILNNIKEVYSYLRLIREPNAGSFKIFCANFCHPDDDDGLEKLNVFLRKVMVRRTHGDTLFNAKLLDLPKPHERTLWEEFSDIERQVYEIVKKRFIQRINNLAKQEGVQKNFGHIWTMILRLRQMCCHTMLLEGTIVDLLEREDFEKLCSLTKEEDTGEEGSALLMHLRHVLQNNKGVKTIEGGLGNSVLTEHESLPLGVTKVTESEGDVGQDHGLYFHFRKYLESLINSEHWEAIKLRTACCACRQLPNDPQVTSCFHIYCLECLNHLQHNAARRGLDQARCTECGDPYTSTQACEDLETFEARATSDSTANSVKPKNRKSKGDDSWLTVRGEVLPSAKTRGLKAQILNWLEEQADIKVIIYTQFLDVVRILGKVCKTEGWSFVTYTGTMSHDARDKAIREFSDATGMKIMLASLKCGGLGLNLTAANRVICLDPWWNVAVENQAFARVYRIGQVQETKFLRLVVKNSIDAAMMATKERKQVDIDAVMESKEKLDVRDLMRLFGKVGDDGEGHPFIFAEGADRFDDDDPNRLVEDDENDELGFMGNEA